MKISLSIIICILVLFIWWCTNQRTLDDLETEIADLEDTIHQCNSQIEEAKSYAWESYEDMEDALNNLETCN